MYSRSAPRRRHGAEFKAKVLAACDEPGASISGVALAHGLNANLVRQWRAGRGVKLAGVMVTAPARSKAPKSAVSTTSPLLGAAPEFVAIEMSAPAKAATSIVADPAGALPSAGPFILVDLRRGPLHLSVRWPTAAGDDCTAWLRELSSGLLK
jgi:transposase